MKSVSALAVPLVAVALAAGGCRVRDVRTVELRVSGIPDAAALARAEAALRKLPDSRLSNRNGDAERCLKLFDADFAAGTVKVRYDSMKVGTKNLVDALARAGFEAEEVRGNGR